jgi:hypothetical protein
MLCYAPTWFSPAGRLVVGPDPWRPMPETTTMRPSDTQTSILRQAAEHEAWLRGWPRCRRSPQLRATPYSAAC